MSTETTATNTIKGMKEFLISSVPGLLHLKQEDLAIKIEKALKARPADKDVITSLFDEVTKVLTPSTTTTEVVSSAVSDSKDTTEPPTTQETAKPKTTKKKLSGKKSTKADNSTKSTPKVKSVNPTGKCPMALLFPETLELDDQSPTLVRAGADQLTSAEMINEFLKYLFNENLSGEVYIAAFWTKKHIKQYDYSSLFRVPVPKNGFVNDLDMLRVVEYAPNVKRLFCMSEYTEAMYFFDGDEFEPVEDKNPYTGETYSVRVSNGMEFEIYITAEITKKVSDFIDEYNANSNK